ncbi:MAG: OmpA family protein [Saprospiraceae bacterium]
MRKLVLLLASLVWLGFWWWWYTCKICTTCGCNKAEIVAPPEIQKESGPILFNFNDSIALIQVGWPAYRDSISSGLDKNQIIEIEGQYLAEEPNISTFENMGIARANAVKRLFPDSLQNKIKLTSLQVMRRPAMVFPFLASTISTASSIEKIEEVGDKTLIYFKYNSDQRIHDDEIENYLTKLAAAQKDSRSAFNVTGFTDNKGNEAANLKLGLHRANAIKKYLVSKGIDADRINVKSMGESGPIADNTTNEGRQKNRRIEIEIIQKQ